VAPLFLLPVAEPPMVTFDNNMARCGEIKEVFKYRIESVALTSNLLKILRV
jgi:hypothetical protein